MDHHTPGLICPWCDELSTGSMNTPGDEGAPSPGDFTVCVYCAQPAVFTVVGLSRLVDFGDFQPEELEALAHMIATVKLLPAHLRLPPSKR